MSTDLQVRQDLVEMRSLPALKITNSEVKEEGYGKRDGGENETEGCETPRSLIPEVLICPPPPRKPKTAASCKRKSDELVFFEMVAREEVEEFFRQFEVNFSKRRFVVLDGKKGA